MTTPPTLEQILAVQKMASGWLTVTQASAESGVPVRSINRAIANQAVIAVKTNVTRVEPASFAAWLTSRR